MEVYLVGGAVRDRLLNLPSRDNDWVVTGATPQQMADLGYKPVGKDFPVFLHPQTKEEYALARTEKKSGHGYHGFTFHTSTEVTLEQDLARRDLTINAMAEDHDGNIIDPHGGQKDLQERILRHVSDAFIEDPVRLLRIARYAARYAKLGFTIAQETQQLLKQIVISGEIDELVAERVWNEISSALDEDTPSVFFMTLRQCNALSVLLPEVDCLFGVPQSARHHPEIDTGVHTMMVTDMSAKLGARNSVRFAALCHDLGKGATPADRLPRHIAHEKKGISLIKKLCFRLRIPAAHRQIAELVCQYHTHCHRAPELRISTILKVLESLDVFRRPERLDDFLLACEADARGRLGFEDSAYPQADIFKLSYQAANQVQINDLVQTGASGEEIKKQLKSRRIAAISGILGKT
ncbi:MAG: multifunctional CCA addition/repair protein [Gammaproteobacteria bacterium]|nr:multifunctional CCA addition/repair protein [Gammaproteobacteria bacterium]MDX2486883.1 multifunctional CCA addition/repair protein [Gammaproteobacteria bacterium]